MSELFEDLESNDKEAVENAKRKLHDQFLTVRDPWLLSGLYDYYLNTNSARSMEILVNLNEPHYIHLFQRLSDSLRRQETDIKVKALTLLGHIVRSQPTWIYKIHEHHLLKDIFYLLKSEDDVLPLISALLLLIVLIPMIPSLMGEFLYDVFDIFSRLASCKCGTGDLIEEHLQVALYALFVRLYGMYPCNFIAYLRSQYRDKNRPVFIHTIKPMLDTVKMHPSLVIASKDNETATERWKMMGVHEVIVECEQFSLDVQDKCLHDCCHFNSGFRSRSGTTNSTTMEAKYQLENLNNLAKINSEDREFFTPSICFQAQTPPIIEASAPTNIHRPHIQGINQTSNIPTQEGTSPPEAAIEATPETTPIRDIHMTPIRSPHLNSNAVRGLTTFGSKIRNTGSSYTTPTHSQPSSPMRKEMSPFNFPENKYSSAFINMSKDVHSNQRLQRLMHDRQQVSETISQDPPLFHTGPSSPLKIIQPESIFTSSSHRNDSSPISQEDEEVLSIVEHKEGFINPLRQCDSVLHENNDHSDENFEDVDEHGSPCTAGGLHMPNSKSMNDFGLRMRRLRFHSQCNAEIEQSESSSGSSPGNCVQFLSSTLVRRANSCPEMKKSPFSTKEKHSKPLKETDEEDDQNVENFEQEQLRSVDHKIFVTIETQTENFFPMPYEHLFLNIFPTLGNSETRPSPSQSPAPIKPHLEKDSQSSYEIIDKYIDISTHSEGSHMKVQMQLLYQQLLFERYRRETHAYRNRRLLADAKNARALDEYNSALRDQVQLKQKDIDNLKMQIDIMKQERTEENKRSSETINYWEDKLKSLQVDYRIIQEQNELLEKKISSVSVKCSLIDEQRQNAEASLLEALAEMNLAREQAWTGEKGRAEVEKLNKEILLFGELQSKYQDNLSELSTCKKFDEEREILVEAYKEEIKSLAQQLESKLSHLEACKCRLSELEYIIVQKDEVISAQKRTLIGVNEECHQKIQAVDSKYQAQIAINKAMEEKILELWQRLELPGPRNVHSPEISSCHEAAIADRISGMSPHSSPLSVSLGSCEGSVAFMNSDMKNLQALVDRKTSKPTEDMESSCDSETMQQQPCCSGHD